MKRILLLTGLFLGTFSMAQNTANSTAFHPWIGYMNCFDLSMNYVFGDFWGVPDIRTDVDSTLDQITLYPNFNTYADNTGDPFWVDQTTMTGAKIMEASTFVEPGGNGQDLTFKGNVQSNTLDAAYTAKYFIKALDPANGYQDALGGSKMFDLPASGEFSVTATGAELATGLIVQFGFVVMGVNANPADEQTLGNVVIVPSTLGLDEKDADVLNIYPNPAMNILNVGTSNTSAQYSIAAVDGKIVKSGTLENGSVNIENLNEGVYLFNLYNEGSVRTSRFVKK